MPWFTVVALICCSASATQQTGPTQTECPHDRAFTYARMVNVAVAQYYWQFGHLPGHLSRLGHPQTGLSTADRADLVPEAVARGNMEGCTVNLQSNGPKSWTVTSGR